MCLYATSATKIAKEDIVTFKVMTFVNSQYYSKNLKNLENIIESPFRGKRYKFRKSYKDNKTDLHLGIKQIISKAFHSFIYFKGAMKMVCDGYRSIVVRCTIPKGSIISCDTTKGEIASDAIILEEVLFSRYDTKDEGPDVIRFDNSQNWKAVLRKNGIKVDKNLFK